MLNISEKAIGGIEKALSDGRKVVVMYIFGVSGLKAAYALKKKEGSSEIDPSAGMPTVQSALEKFGELYFEGSRNRYTFRDGDKEPGQKDKFDNLIENACRKKSVRFSNFRLTAEKVFGDIRLTIYDGKTKRESYNVDFAAAYNAALQDFALQYPRIIE
jgi:hypothetical protein